MNDFIVKTINQLQDAMDQVEIAREKSGLSKTDRLNLEKAFVQLRNTERTITRQKEKNLAVLLEQDTKALNDLAVQITASANKLDEVGKSIQKATKTVQALVNILITASTAGLL